MNLFEYMQQHEEEEITVFDKDYDIETYFYGDFYGDGFAGTKDDWDRAMDKIAEHLEIVEELTNRDRPCVVVNMTEVMEKSLESGTMDDLFISKNIDAVMGDMHNILAGYVSEEWLMDFADALDKADSFQQEKECRTAEALEI